MGAFKEHKSVEFPKPQTQLLTNLVNRKFLRLASQHFFESDDVSYNPVCN